MKETYRPDLKAHVLLDASNRVRTIRHTQEFWESDQGSALSAAMGYINSMAGVYSVPSVQLAKLQQKVQYLEPQKTQDVEFRLADEKVGFDSATVSFYQTYANIPVWKAGIKVTVKQGPNRIVHSVDTSHDDIQVKMPADKILTKYRELFKRTDLLRTLRAAGHEDGESEENHGAGLVRDISGLTGDEKRSRKGAAVLPATRLIRGRFWIYQYDKEARFYTSGKQITDQANRNRKFKRGEVKTKPTDDFDDPRLPVGPVSRKIKDGGYYAVAEMTFEAPYGNDQHMVWKALVELETQSVLYLRAMTSGVDGLVFEQDPYSKSGNLTAVPSSSNAVLNPLRDDVTLQNIDAPVAGTQFLKGSYAQVTNVEGLNPAIPNEPTGTDFDYNVRTNDFGAVCAYFNVDRLFRHIADLGFNISTYFANTTFPVKADHRCWSGNTINAHCIGNGTGGIGHVGYGLMDNTDTTNPLCRVCDPYVTWHELGGHGILYEAVDSPNMNFTHSAGDGLAGIFNDPTADLDGLDGTPIGKPGSLRFCYTPWHPTLNRRMDRDVTTGWAWGGLQDNSGYQSEQILATTHFNIYRSIGGDSPHESRRVFASRVMMYLILRAIGSLTPTTDPNYARDFAAELMATDLLNWTSEGIYGGAYNKVIRWAFEQQGEYQSPLITNGGPGDGTIVAPGDPPEFDVYIDDGRAGEYQYQQVHWHTTTIWNRQAADSGTTHQEPILGQTNYAYVKIKNRGTQTANNVVVKGYHTKPGAGLLWPSDFEAFTTATINVGTLAANNGQEKTIGPFDWTPNINAYGHDCMLMIVSADGDPSNVDNFTAGESIQEWRLVPHDNNVGQRNVNPVPGGGGSEGLMAGLDGVGFWVGNPDPKRASMRLKVDLPDLLVRAGWHLKIEGVNDKTFTLASGAKREVILRLVPGAEFTPEMVRAVKSQDIVVTAFANGNPIGGMTYRLDPDIERPVNQHRHGDRCCAEQAQKLIDCLGVNRGKVKKAKIKEIIVGVKMDNDCC